VQAEPAGTVILRGKTKPVQVFRVDHIVDQENGTLETGEVTA
jgi:hypothetical protein